MAISPFKVTDFGTNRKPTCDFLLVINTNVHPISHRFEVIADYWSYLRFGQRGTPLGHTRSEWTPKFRTMKFSPKKLETLLYRTYGIHIFTENHLVLSQYGRISIGNHRFYRATAKHTHGFPIDVCPSVRPSNACIVTKRKHLAKKVQLWLIRSRPRAFQCA